MAIGVDFANEFQTSASLVGANDTTTTNGTAVDLSNTHNLCVGICEALQLTSDTLTFTLQESGTSTGPFTTMLPTGNGSATGTVTATTTVLLLSAQRTLRYGRITVTNAAADSFYAVGLLTARKRQAPNSTDEGYSRSPSS